MRTRPCSSTEMVGQEAMKMGEPVAAGVEDDVMELEVGGSVAEGTEVSTGRRINDGGRNGPRLLDGHNLSPGSAVPE